MVSYFPLDATSSIPTPDALEANGNLLTMVINNSPTFVNATNFGERVAMLLNATDEAVAAAVLHNHTAEAEIWKDPNGLRPLLKVMLDVPPGYDHLPKGTLGQASRKHPAYFVSVCMRPSVDFTHDSLFQLAVLFMNHSYNLLLLLFTLPAKNAVPCTNLIHPGLLMRINALSKTFAGIFQRHTPWDPESVDAIKYFESIRLEISNHLTKLPSSDTTEALSANLADRVDEVRKTCSGCPIFCNNTVNAILEHCKAYGPGFAFVSVPSWQRGLRSDQFPRLRCTPTWCIPCFGRIRPNESGKRHARMQRVFSSPTFSIAVRREKRSSRRIRTLKLGLV